MGTGDLARRYLSGDGVVNAGGGGLPMCGVSRRTRSALWPSGVSPRRLHSVCIAASPIFLRDEELRIVPGVLAVDVPRVGGSRMCGPGGDRVGPGALPDLVDVLEACGECREDDEVGVGPRRVVLGGDELGEGPVWRVLDGLRRPELVDRDVGMEVLPKQDGSLAEFVEGSAEGRFAAGRWCCCCEREGVSLHFELADVLECDVATGSEIGEGVLEGVGRVAVEGEELAEADELVTAAELMAVVDGAELVALVAVGGEEVVARTEGDASRVGVGASDAVEGGGAGVVGDGEQVFAY